MDSDILYYERQRTPLLWGIIILLPINIPFIYGLVKQLIFKQSWGDNPMSDTELIIASVLVFFFGISMFVFKLETIITKEGIYVRFFPLMIRYKLYLWENTAKMEVKKHAPLRRYGGWGYKIGMKRTAFTMRGSMGLELILNNNREVFIGTGNPQELQAIIDKFKH
ncbi:MAG: hypothetical protein LBH82_01435 [Bacteroidales bacterium]|jgi:hypothetical protein|nr:hypothetical protein [Bacteroidales bacterium]